jgi:hypothetical protein
MKKAFSKFIVLCFAVFSLYGCSNDTVSKKELYEECMSDTQNKYVATGLIVGIFIPPHIVPSLIFGGIGWGYWYFSAEDDCRIETGYFPSQDGKNLIPKTGTSKSKKVYSGGEDGDIYKSVFGNK